MSRRARIRSQHVRRTPHVVLNAWQIAINGACKLSDKDVAGHIALITRAKDEFTQGISCDQHWLSLADTGRIERIAEPDTTARGKP